RAIRFMITLETFVFEPRSAHSRSRLMPAAPFDFHRPVLLADTVEALQPVENRLFIDGTLGGGGHAEALLHAGARVIGFDRDATAVADATTLLAGLCVGVTA